MTKPPRSELFLSCDLVGSTNFKQRNEDWPRHFLGFYRQFPQMVGDLAAASELTFDLWKAVGDELIFTVKVVHERHVYDAVRVWLRAMKQYEDEVLAEATDMKVKGGGFIATFPGPDCESSVPRNPTTETSDKSPVLLNDDALSGHRAVSKFLFDYFGPSIDTGFRVISHCTERYFTLSVEVAWACFAAALNDNDRNTRDAIFLGTKAMKGVWRGREYPLFAFDRHISDGINEHIRALLAQNLDASPAIDLCRACVTSPGWPSAIYLPESGFDSLKKQPVDRLAPLRLDNDMIGSEEPPEESPDEGAPLDTDAPLG